MTSEEKARILRDCKVLGLGFLIALIVWLVIFERHFAADYAMKTNQINSIIQYLNTHPIK